MTSPLSIFMYHRVAAPSVDPWNLAVTPALFASHIETIQSAGEVIALLDDLESCSPHRPRRGAQRFAITFDDGYACNFLTALPILESFDAPATFFIATGFLDQPSFWWDRLAEILFDDELELSHIRRSWNSVIGRSAFADSTHGADIGSVSDDGRSNGRAAMHFAMWERLVGLHPRDIDHLLDELCDELSTHAHHGDGRPLTTEELKEFARHPLVDIGGHTVAHRQLGSLPPEDALLEISEGMRRLDELLGPRDRVLAYPYGHTNRDVADLAARCGFRYAVTTVPRDVSVLDRNMLLPRHDPPGVSPAEFLQILRRREGADELIG